MARLNAAEPWRGLRLNCGGAEGWGAGVVWGRCGKAGSSTPAAPGVVNTLPANTAQFPRSVLLSWSLEICSVPSRAHDLHAVTPLPTAPQTPHPQPRTFSGVVHSLLTEAHPCPEPFPPGDWCFLSGLPTSPRVCSLVSHLFSPGRSSSVPGLLSFFPLVSHLSAGQLPLWRPAKCPLRKQSRPAMRSFSPGTHPHIQGPLGCGSRSVCVCFLLTLL